MESLNNMNREKRDDSNKTLLINIFKKAYETYQNGIIYNKKEAFGCNLCPQELRKGELEEDFRDVIECHINDGIDRGSIENPTKGFVANAAFNEEKVPLKKKENLVRGTTCQERSFLHSVHYRNLTEKVIHDNFSTKSLDAAIREISKDKNNKCSMSFVNLLNDVKKMKNVPERLNVLISELTKDSPVSIWLPSYDIADYDLLTKFLKKECNVFQDSL